MEPDSQNIKLLSKHLELNLDSKQFEILNTNNKKMNNTEAGG